MRVCLIWDVSITIDFFLICGSRSFLLSWNICQFCNPVGFEPTTSAMLKFYPDTGKPVSHDDAIKVAPDSYKVSLENDQVRVLEVRIKQGAKVEMHSHPRSVAICLND